MKRQYYIGDLAQRVGVARSLVRYYEDISLLPPANRTTSGYRVYSKEDVERLQFIQRAKALDFSLEEIREILASREQGQAPCAYVVNQIDAKIDAVEQKITALSRLKSKLKQLQSQAAGLPATNIEATNCVCHLIENQGLTALNEIEIGA